MDTSVASSPAPVATTTPSADTTATPDSDKLKRKRQPRNSACQGCAALKMKCIGTANGKCERCNRMDRECVPAVPKPRKRRTQSNVGLDLSPGPTTIPLSDILGSEQPSPTVPPPIPRFEPPPPPPKRLEYHDGAARDALLTRPDIAQSGSRSFASLLAQGLGNVAACEELLRGVDYHFVQASCNLFREVDAYFPFVHIPAGTDLISLVTQRPVLTVAVCIVASANHPEVQSRLNQAFRYALSSKVVLGGERGIDLLAGLLVYLAWHHHYMSQQQIYQKLCLLAGMAADLELYRKPSRREARDPVVNLERDRAFIGCYYLSCSLSRIGFDKPNPVRWTDNLRLCAENVARAGSLPSDTSLVAIVELVHVLEDMEESLRFDSNGKPSSSVNPLSIDLHAKAANHRLKALKREYPTLGGTLGFAAASIHVYARLWQSGQTPDYSTLIQCACAMKEYLDDLLARPASTLHKLAIVDWIFLLEILVLMALIAKPPTNLSGLEAEMTKMLQPEALLDALYTRMASTPSNDPLTLRDESLLRWFGAICDGIKRHILHDSGTSPDADGRFKAVNDKPGQRPGDNLPQQVAPPICLNDGVLDETFLRILTNAA